MTLPPHLKYATTHEWVCLEESPTPLTRVGITEHAQAELSDIVYVELPAVGTLVAAGDSIAVVESVKAASDIYTPVSGKVTQVNEELIADPSLVNSDSFGAGWLFEIELSDPSELEKLLSSDKYAEHIGN